MALHIVFDAIAWVAAGLSLLLLTKWTDVRFAAAPISDIHYIAALIFGAGVGAVLFGTANAWLSHQTSMARSIEGAITGDPATGDATLKFSALTGVAAMIETMPLEKAPEAYARMMAGKARFRMVLTMQS